MLHTLLNFALSDAGLTAIATGLGIVLAFILRARNATKAAGVVLKVAHLVYDAVNAFKDATPTKVDDKAALGLKVLVGVLDRELSPKEAEAAKAVFDARHAQEKAAIAMVAKVAAAAGK